jgi:hypothetical protein
VKNKKKIIISSITMLALLALIIATVVIARKNKISLEVEASSSETVESTEADEGIADIGTEASQETLEAVTETKQENETDMTDTKVADGETEETVAEETAETTAQDQPQTVSEQPTASSSGQEMTDWAKQLTDNGRETFKKLGLTDEQINALSEEEATEIWRNHRNSNSSSTSNDNSDSSTNTDEDGVVYDSDFLPIGELGQYHLGGEM